MRRHAQPSRGRAGHRLRGWLKCTQISKQILILFKVVKSATSLFIKVLKRASGVQLFIFTGSSKQKAHSCNPCKKSVFSFPKPHVRVK